jgi:hypothetical protein
MSHRPIKEVLAARDDVHRKAMHIRDELDEHPLKFVQDMLPHFADMVYDGRLTGCVVNDDSTVEVVLDGVVFSSKTAAFHKASRWPCYRLSPGGAHIPSPT